jgi:hypothetical protein
MTLREPRRVRLGGRLDALLTSFALSLTVGATTSSRDDALLRTGWALGVVRVLEGESVAVLSVCSFFHFVLKRRAFTSRSSSNYD